MQIHDSFQFYDNSLLHQNVCLELSDYDITVIYLYGIFHFRLQATCLQFDGQCFLVY